MPYRNSGECQNDSRGCRGFQGTLKWISKRFLPVSRGFEGLQQISRQVYKGLGGIRGFNDFHRISGVSIELKEHLKGFQEGFLRSSETFQGVSRGFEGFQEVPNVSERFQGISGGF